MEARTTAIVAAGTGRPSGVEDNAANGSGGSVLGSEPRNKENDDKNGEQPDRE